MENNIILFCNVILFIMGIKALFVAHQLQDEYRNEIKKLKENKTVN